MVNKELGFLLPDLLGKPKGLTKVNKNTGNTDLIFPEGAEIPQDSFIFFISFEDWKRYKGTDIEK